MELLHQMHSTLGSAEAELTMLESLIGLVSEQARALKPYRVTFIGAAIRREITVVATSTCNAILIAMDLVFETEVDEELSITAKPLGKASPVSDKVAA